MTQCKLQLIFTWTVAFGSMAMSGLIMDALIRQSKIFTWILGRWEEEMMYFQQEFLPFISMSNVGVTNLKKTTKPWWQKLIILICTLILLAWHVFDIRSTLKLTVPSSSFYDKKKIHMERSSILRLKWFFIINSGVPAVTTIC